MPPMGEMPYAGREVIELSSDDDNDDDYREQIYIDLTLHDAEPMPPDSETIISGNMQNSVPPEMSVPETSAGAHAEASSLAGQRDATPVQLDNDLRDPENTHDNIGKLTINPSMKKIIHPQVRQEAPAIMTLEDRVLQINEQIEDDHRVDMAAIHEECMNIYLNRPPPRFKKIDFLDPPQAFLAPSSEAPLRMVSSQSWTQYSPDGGGPFKTTKLTITAKDISQQEDYNIPEYSHYTTIERSFLVNHPELPPNYRLPNKLENRDDEERWEDHLENDKLRELEKARSFRPYRARILGAIRRARDEDPENESRIRAIFKDVLGLDEDGLRELLAGEKKDRTERKSAEGGDTTYLQGCFVCGTHHCSVHGVYEAPSSSEPSSNGSRSSSPSRARQHKKHLRGFTRKVEFKEPPQGEGVYTGEDTSTKPCGNNCYKENATHSLDEMPEISPSIRDAIQLTYDLDIRTPCSISAIIGLPCHQVHSYMSTNNIRPGAFSTVPEKKLPKSKKGLNTENEHMHDARPQPTPCFHPGLSCSLAGKQCSCARQKIYCYKQCGCPSNCSRRYQGCRCSGKNACKRVNVANPDALVRSCRHAGKTEGCMGCKLKGLEAVGTRCLCQRLNRECDPDVCRCGVAACLSERGGDDGKTCHNCAMQKGGMRDMVVGASAEAGYGLFVNEDVAFGEYLGEYVGEVIDAMELARREDAMRNGDMNYLFRLNGERSVDSGTWGNVTRFVNHKVRGCNCRAVVVLVNGEHRIGFWSVMDLRRGEELFFDYGVEFDEVIHGGEGKDGGVEGNGGVKEGMKVKDKGKGKGKEVPRGEEVQGGMSDGHGDAPEEDLSSVEDEDDDDESWGM